MSCMKFSVWAVFACCAVFSASAETKTFVGANNAEWTASASWDPAGEPGSGDDVVISNGANVKALAGGITVKSLTLSGSGSKLTLGQTSNLPGTILTVTEDLTVTESAVLSVQAGALADTSPFGESQEAASAALYANPTVIQIGGTLSVSAGGTVCPANDPLTGTPVFFRTTTFDLGVGGVFDVRNLGWNWFSYSGLSSLPAGAKLNVYGSSPYYSYSFGPGFNYNASAGYGGLGGNVANVSYSSPAESAWKSGQTYGSAYAPFLAGSPSGIWGSSWDRGSGTIAVFATGAVSLAGTLNADGRHSASYANLPGTSGGSIWICGDSVSLAASSVLTAAGGCVGQYANSVGGGGRIAVCEGLSQEQIDTLAGGETPGAPTYDVTTLTSLGTLSVRGGPDSKNYYGTYGTMYRIVNLMGKTALTTAGDPVEAISPGLMYGTEQVKVGSVTRTVDAIAKDPTHPLNWSRTCLGWTLKDKTDTVVDSGETPTATFTVTGADGPYTLTWRWDEPLGNTYYCIDRIGGGTLTVDGTLFETNAYFRLPVTGTHTLQASANDGYRFLGWLGLDGGFVTATTITAETSGRTLTALFEPVSGATYETKTWVGSDSDMSWDTASNWDPAGVPSLKDDVVITGRDCTIPLFAHAHSITVGAGRSLFLSATGTPTAPTAVSSTVGNTRQLFLTGGLTVEDGGSAVLGGENRVYTNLFVGIGGDVRLNGSAGMSVCAVPLDLSLPSGTNELRAAATAVTIGGDLVLNDTSVLYPYCDKYTGTAVRFEVASNLTVATGARIDAASRGWGWREQGATPDPFLRHVQSSEAGSSVTAETRAFGPGYRINIGGGHGARGDDRRGKADNIPEAYIKEYGNPYGYATAPFLPGSPNGTFNYTDVKRGGGVVWITCGRKIFLDGMIVADCDRAFYSGGSGGSVWLLGRSVDAGATAAITAIGGGVDDKQGYLAGGAGGRVAVVLGATDEEVSALARGERPEGLSYTNQIDFVSVNVSGGPEGTQQGARPEPYAPTGTVMFVRGTLASKAVNVRANVQAGSPTPAYGQSSADVGDVLTFTATQDGYGADPSDPQTSRWRCAGYVVSNATEEVARGSAATFDIEMPNEDLVVTWIWADKENQLSVGNPQGAAYGSVTVDGQPSETGMTFWKGASATFTAYAVPADGCEFLYWAGDFPYGQAKTNPLTVAVAAKKHLWPVFRRSEAPTVRTFIVADGASAGFHDESAWSGGNFPGIEDEVVIASGRCSAWSNNYVEVKSLVVSNAATRFVLGVQKLTTDVSFGPAAARVNNDFPTACSTLAEEVALVVADDVTIACGAQLGVGSPYANRKAHGRLTAANVTLADDSQLMVVAGGVDEGTFTRANGAGLVTVAGTFDVRDTAVFRPASRPSDGGSVKTTARRFSLATGATVSAWGMGYKSETSPGSGLTYTIGAGYGGCGGNHTVVYGNAYGQAAAPIHPGSSGGLWSDTQMAGGGLVRIHAKAMTIDGTVDVRPEQNWAADRWYSGGAGGGIWLSAATFAFGAEAKLLASGGPAADYPTGAGGGRIALVRSADDAELTALAETGAAPHLKIRDRAAFDAAYPDHTLTIDVHGGDRYTDTADPSRTVHEYVGPSGEDGTFAFVVPAPGLMVIIR